MDLRAARKNIMRSRDTYEDLMDEVGHWRNRPFEERDHAFQGLARLAADVLNSREDGRRMLTLEFPHEENALDGWYRLVRRYR